jgi:DNA polymerase III epsilon subunit-like protein
MLVLGLDIETTGLDFEKDEIVEIGAVLWDTQTSKPISVVSLLISDNEMLITEDSQKIHGISKQDCQYGVLLTEAMGTVMGMWQHAEFVVAHNGRQFDLPFM